MTPEEWLNSWDWILINSSGGKDSQTTLRVVHQACAAAGVPPERLVVVHADLGRVEWQETKALARQQAEHYGLRFEVVARSQDDLLQHVEKRGKWPSNKQRYCTSDHKRGPIRTLMTRLAKESRAGSAKVRVLNCMGMRAQESPARAKKPPLAFDKSASNGRREVWNWLPIHTWTIDRVWANIRESGVPHHFTYDLGMPRLSCCFCIFSPKAALVLAGKHNRALLDEYVRVEQAINHKFRVDVSLEDIRTAVVAGEDAGDVADWRM